MKMSVLGDEPRMSGNHSIPVKYCPFVVAKLQSQTETLLDCSNFPIKEYQLSK